MMSSASTTSVDSSGTRGTKRPLSAEISGDDKKLRKMDDSEVCNFCMQEMKAEQDPRVLPCGHEFCLRCLMDDCTSKGTTSYQCITCKRVYGQMDFNSLPTGLTTSESSEVAEELGTASDVLYCDRCLDKPAVRYCVDCGEKSCVHHMEHHEGYYEGLHETLDIMKYAENPSLHNKAITCLDHKKERITMACKRCYKYNCLQCCEEITPCDGSDGDHIYHSLVTIEEEIKQTFDQLLKQISENLTEVEEIEKQVWTKHDELLVKCKDMVAAVEKDFKQKIEQIRIQTEQLKASIQQYQAEKVDQVVTFVTELMKKKEEIEEVKRSTHKFLRNKHVTELIKAKKQKVDLLNQAIAIDLGTCDWTTKSLHEGVENCKKLELRSVQLKSKPSDVGFAVCATVASSGFGSTTARSGLFGARKLYM